jgi:hypothetical protein
MVRRDDTEVREASWLPAVRFARWLLGALTLVGGVTWVLLNLHGPNPVTDLVAGAILAAGGLVLLMPHRITLPRRATAIAVLAGGVVGTAAGLLAQRARECCEFAYVEDRGWPFVWLQRGALADDPDRARLLARSAHWTADYLALASDFLIWAYAGMLVMVIVVLVRRPRG